MGCVASKEAVKSQDKDGKNIQVSNKGKKEGIEVVAKSNLNSTSSNQEPLASSIDDKNCSPAKVVDSKLAVIDSKLSSTVKAVDSKVASTDSKLTSTVNTIDTKVASADKVVDAKLASPGLVVDNKLAAPGIAIDNKLSAPGMALDNKLAASGMAVDNKLVASGTAVDNKVSASGTALDNKLAASGVAVDNKLAASGMAVDNKVPASGISIDNKLAAPGIAIDNKLSASGTVIDNKLAASGMAVDNKLAASGMALDNKLAASGTALDNKVPASGTAVDNKVPASGISIDNKLAAPGTVFDNKLSASGTAIDNKLAASGMAVDKKLSTSGTTLDNKLAASGMAIDNKLAAPGIAIDNKASAPGTTLDNKLSASGMAVDNKLAASGMAFDNKIASTIKAADARVASSDNAVDAKLASLDQKTVQSTIPENALTSKSVAASSSANTQEDALKRANATLNAVPTLPASTLSHDISSAQATLGGDATKEVEPHRKPMNRISPTMEGIIPTVSVASSEALAPTAGGVINANKEVKGILPSAVSLTEIRPKTDGSAVPNGQSPGVDTDKQLNSKIDLIMQKLNTTDSAKSDTKSPTLTEASGEVKKQVVAQKDQMNPMKYESGIIGTIDRPRAQSPTPEMAAMESQTATALINSRSKSPSNPLTVEGGGGVLQPRTRAKSPTPGLSIGTSEKTAAAAATAAGVTVGGYSSSVGQGVTDVHTNLSAVPGAVVNTTNTTTRPGSSFPAPISVSPRAVLESPTSPTFVTTPIPNPSSVRAVSPTSGRIVNAPEAFNKNAGTVIIGGGGVGDILSERRPSFQSHDQNNGVHEEKSENGVKRSPSPSYMPPKTPILEIRHEGSNGSQGSINDTDKYSNSHIKRYDSKNTSPISPSYSANLADKQGSPSLLSKPKSVKSIVGDWSDGQNTKKDSLSFLSDRSETMSEEQSQNDNNSIHSDGSRVRNKTTTSDRYQAYLKEKKMKKDRESTGSSGTSPARAPGASPSSPRTSGGGSPKHPNSVKNLVGKWNEIIPAGTAKSNGYKDRNSEGTVKAEKKYSTF